MGLGSCDALSLFACFKVLITRFFGGHRWTDLNNETYI